MISDSLISGCGYGIQTAMGQDALPGLYVTGCHINCYSVGIALENLSAAIISDNNIYMYGGPENGYHVAINTGTFAFGSYKDVLIRGNLIGNNTEVGGGESGSFGVLVPASPANDSILITDNQFVDFD